MIQIDLLTVIGFLVPSIVIATVASITVSSRHSIAIAVLKEQMADLKTKVDELTLLIKSP